MTGSSTATTSTGLFLSPSAAQRGVSKMWRSKTSSTLTLLVTLAMINYFSKPQEAEGVDASKADRLLSGSKSKARVDMAFLRRISRLLRVMVPGVCSIEAAYLAAVAGLLLARTSLDVVMLNLTTTIERSIVGREKSSFNDGMSRFAQLCVPVAVVNSLLKYFQSELSLRFRQRLTEHVMTKYMKGFTFYAVSNLDDRIPNPDQAITQDIERFADSVAELYSNVTKPVLDMLVYVRRLSDTVDPVAPATMIAYLLLSGVALGALRKPTAVYTALVAQQEGEYRYVNSRLLTNAQEIAFYKGNKKEEQVLKRAFQKLIGITRRSERFRHSLGILDSVVAKYFATIVGWTVVSRPFVNRRHPRHATSTSAEVYQDYHSSGRMMLNLSAALGRLVLSGREMARLSGFSSRVTGLINVINDGNRGVYMKRGQYQDNQAGVGSTAARNTTGISNGFSTGSAATETAEVAMRTAAAAAEAARIHETAAVKRDGSRNAGVAGVNLSTQHTPQWSSSITRKVATGLRLTATPPRDTIISSPGTNDASVTGKAAGDAMVESDNYGGVRVRGQLDLAPDFGVGAGEVASEPRGEGDVMANGDGEEVIGGGKLSRSGGGSRETAGSSPEGGGAGKVVGGGALSRSGSLVVNEERVIEFKDVPLVTPSGEVLIEALSFKVEAGMNVLVAGPNGSGKSSLFRVLGGLWPLRGGILVKPPTSRLFYVPQRPYLALGTLRDQVIYPHTREEAASKGVTDESLLTVLKSVRLEYLLPREGGWDTVRDWTEVLSGGEKQRLALSRLFYHKPQFAILDECTSAVSVDVEGSIYSLAARSGITLFTVSHRKSLWKHHSYLLRFDGLGGYEFKPMSDVVSGEDFGS